MARARRNTPLDEEIMLRALALEGDIPYAPKDRDPSIFGMGADQLVQVILSSRSKTDKKAALAELQRRADKGSKVARNKLAELDIAAIEALPNAKRLSGPQWQAIRGQGDREVVPAEPYIPDIVEEILKLRVYKAETQREELKKIRKESGAHAFVAAVYAVEAMIPRETSRRRQEQLQILVNSAWIIIPVGFKDK